MNTYKKQIVSDCAKAIAPALLFNLIESVAGSVVLVYTASVLGKFTNAVFNLDFSYGIANFRELLLCVLITLFGMPIFGMVAEILLFSNSLKHDRMVYGRYLSKTFREATVFADGELEYRLEQDAIDLRCTWLDLATKYVSIPVTLIYLLYHCLRISFAYTLIIFLVSAVKYIVPIAIRNLKVKYDKETREYETIVREYEVEMMEQPHKIKLYGLSEPLSERLNQAYQVYFRNVFTKSSKCTVVADNISKVLDTFCTVLILIAGTLMIAGGVITAGDMIAMFGFYSIFNTLTVSISSVIQDTPIFGTIAERMTVFYKDQEEDFGESISAVNHIVVSDLGFSYDEKQTLEHVNFEIREGDKIAICGQNGNGKSTLIKLLCGVLKGYSGHIKINGRELSEISIKSWYRNIAYTEQDPYLFSGTVRENIHLGNLNASEKELDEVIQEVGIDYLVHRDISMDNHELSGGEKQKISIARALMKRTPILIMDEPSNNLDRDTVKWLQDFIRKSSKTIIFVSHDSELLSCADDMVCL